MIKTEKLSGILEEQCALYNDNILKYDTSRWEETKVKPLNTLQMFITNKCNLRCKGCFYAHNLGEGKMNIDRYKLHVLDNLNDIKKVVILGGEPTLHNNLPRMIRFNNACRLRTTIYTNGYKLGILEGMRKQELRYTEIRIGVHGTVSSEKPLMNIKKTSLPVTITYMLTRENGHELMTAAKIAEKDFNCKKFYISSIRDILTTQDYWKDTEETLPMEEYFNAVQRFVNDYKGKMDIHIAWRGVVRTQDEKARKGECVNKCRFGNIFPDDKKIVCPLDISKNVYSDELRFNERQCNKNSSCILTKIVLKNKMGN